MAERSERKKSYEQEVENEMVRCLQGDTRAVARVCSDIISWTGSLPQNRFSGSSRWKHYAFQEYMRDSSADMRLTYIATLEQALNVLRDFLNLTVSYTDQIATVSEAFPSYEIAVSKISFSALAWMLWARLQYISNSIYKNMKLRHHQEQKKLMDQSVQTDEWKEENCKTCHLAQETILRLADSMENVYSQCKIRKGAIHKTRQEMDTVIYYVSQEDAMKTWCTSIVKDMNYLECQVKEIKHRNARLGDQVQAYKTESLMNINKLRELNKKKDDLFSLNGKGFEGRSLGRLQIKEMTEKCKEKTEECEKWKKKYEELKASSTVSKPENIEIKIPATEKEKGALISQQLLQKSTAIEEAKMELEKMKKEFSTTTFSLKDEIATKEVTISTLTRSIELLEKKQKQSDVRISELQREVAKEQAHGTQIWKSYKELKSQKEEQDAELDKKYAEMDEMRRRLNEVEGSILSLPAWNITITGNPKLDMLNEKERNEVAIKYLKEQNSQLSIALENLEVENPALMSKSRHSL